jgi:hypothetical protein
VAVRSTSVVCTRVTGEWALFMAEGQPDKFLWHRKVFGHVSSCGGSFIIRSMGFHGRSGSFEKAEEGNIFGPPVHKFDNGQSVF